jgi:hypothetical protein
MGPMSGKFNFPSTILESKPPEHGGVDRSDLLNDKSAVNADMTVDLRGVSDAKPT